MTRAISAALACIAASAVFPLLYVSAAAAQAPAQTPRGDDGPRRTLTLTGCVEKGTTPNQFTITDGDNGKYEVSGNRIGRYVGQRVMVAGTPGSTRFRMKGGLWPSPNAAAQGGSLDPARAAIAAQPGGPAAGTGEISLPTFKVKSVRTLDGRCE